VVPSAVIARVARRRGDLADGAPPLERPSFHDGDVRAVLGHVRQDVRRHDQGLALLAQLAEQLSELHPPRRVEPRRRLVQQYDRRIRQQRPRQTQALFHPARQRLDLLRRLLRQPDPLQPIRNVGLHVRVAQAVPLGDEPQVGPDVHLLVQRRRVGREPHPRHHRRARLEDLPQHPDLARRRRLQPRHRPQQRRLAGAVGPDQAEQIAAAEREGDVVDGDERAELHAQRLHVHQWRGLGWRGSVHFPSRDGERAETLQETPVHAGS
jgi:hypothetical protein